MFVPPWARKVEGRNWKSPSYGPAPLYALGLSPDSHAAVEISQLGATPAACAAAVMIASTSPPDELVPVGAGAGAETRTTGAGFGVGGAVGGMRTIRTGSGVGTVGAAANVDGAVAPGVDAAVEDDADAAFVPDEEGDATAADADPRSRARAKDCLLYTSRCV